MTNAVMHRRGVRKSDTYDTTSSFGPSGRRNCCAASLPANDLVARENTFEEVKSVGGQLLAVESLLLQALVQAEGAAGARYGDWRANARGFRAQAANRIAPSMRRKLDIGRIYCQALRALPETMDARPRWPLSETCLATSDELLSGSL